MTKKIFKVSEITSLIKEDLEANYDGVWIEGEISNIATPYSGHCYLTLKDSESQIRVVIFKYVNQFLKFKLENGLQIVVYGKISVYAPRGEYQLVATKVEPKGLGALQLAFEQLKKKLAKEGLFDEENKKDLPFLPRKIGIVTSATGAAIRDILNILDRRFQNVNVKLVPVRVQGEGSAEEIAHAIKMFNEYGNIDVMIIGRGGGSMEDLWAFNEEVVARAIYKSKIPIISAVGHEIDFTISDFVADLRAPTPSAAAELVVAKKEDLEERVIGAISQIQQNVLYLLENLRTRVEAAAESYFLKQPKAIIETYMQQVDHLIQSLSSVSKNRVKDLKHEFASLIEQLELLNPLGMLKRGYSLAYNENQKLISKVNHVKPREKLVTQVSDGKITSVVSDIEKS